MGLSELYANTGANRPRNWSTLIVHDLRIRTLAGKIQRIGISPGSQIEPLSSHVQLMVI